MSDEPDYYHTFVDLICSFNTEPIVVQNAEEHEYTSTPGPPMADHTRTFVDLICSFNTEPSIVVQNDEEHEPTSTSGPPMADHTLPSNELTIFNIAPEEGFSGSARSSDPGFDEFSSETSDQANYSLKWNDDFFTKPNPVWNIENNESTFTTEPPTFNVALEEGFSYNATTSDPPIEFSLETPYLTSYSSEEPSIRLQTASDKYNYFYGTFIVASGLNNCDRYSSSLMMQEFSDEVESFESQANNSTSVMVNESLGVYSFESPSDFENWSSYQQTKSYTSFETLPDHTLLSTKENIGQLTSDYDALPSHQLFFEQSANGNVTQGCSTRVPIEAAPGDSLQSGTLISGAPNDDKRSLRDIVESYPLVQHSGPDNRPIYGRLFCDNCPHLYFSSTPELHAHYIRVHPRVPKVRCWKCSRRFHCQDNLIKHLRFVHYDKKGYKCSMCPAEFSHLEDFLTHEQRMHVGLSPILCNICPQKFYSPAALEYHLYLFHPRRKPS